MLKVKYFGFFHILAVLGAGMDVLVPSFFLIGDLINIEHWI